jgi:transposase InsO family protein
LTDFTFEFIRHPISPILSPSSRTFVELTLITKQAKRTFEEVIKTIRTDNGSEFKNYAMEDFMGEEGIKHEFSAPCTPQQNGVVERKNRTIIEMARTMLDEFKSPHNFWGRSYYHRGSCLQPPLLPPDVQQDAL